MDERSEDNSSAFARVPTGVPGLDTILRGGLLRGGIYTVEGLPGAGKTILGNQISFAHAAAGGRVVYISLVTESLARMLGHLRSLTFDNPAAVGDTVYYLSGPGSLMSQGLDGLLELARGAVRDRDATLLVLDGLATVQEVAHTPLATRTFIQQLQLFLETMGCTALMLMRPGVESGTTMQTMVDGVVTLRDQTTETHPIRYLSIQKLRGSGFLRGDHAYEITKDGITVYPRIEAQYAAPPQATTSPEREAMSFGAANLDAMLQKHLYSGSTTILYGASGTGKTVLGLHFLNEGARREQPGLYFGFYEQPSRLFSMGERMGLDLGGATGRGLLEWLWQPPLEQGIDALTARLLAAVERIGARRLVLDGLDQMRLAAFPGERFPAFFAALSNELRARNVASVITYVTQEIFTATVTVPGSIGPIADNILFLRPVELDGRLYRDLSIVKMRDGGYDRTIRELQITDSGADVADVPARSSVLSTELTKPDAGGFASPTSPMELHDADDSRR